MEDILRYIALHGPFGWWNYIIFPILYGLIFVCGICFLLGVAQVVLRETILPGLLSLACWLVKLPFRLLRYEARKIGILAQSRRVKRTASSITTTAPAQSAAPIIEGSTAPSALIDPALLEKWIGEENQRPREMLH